MEIVEDFTDLSALSDEKLLKLRDVAKDNVGELSQEVATANRRLRAILIELEKRKNA